MRLLIVGLLLFLFLFGGKSLETEEVKILAYNVFLRPGLVGKDDYKSERFAELVEAVRPYDIIGLSEVFDDELRDKWKNRLRNTHPYAIDPPESSNIFYQDGGITFFSRYPVSFYKKMIYKASTGWDAYSEKGAIFARITLPDGRTIEVVLSHTQADEKNFDVRKKQFNELQSFIQKYNTSVPLFIIGDLNVIGDKDQQYPDMMARLGNPIDAYRSTHTDPGYTYYKENPFCGSGSMERLDYILMQHGAMNMWKKAAVNRFPMAHPVGKAKYMSDHFAVEATVDFDPSAQREMHAMGSISIMIERPVSLQREIEGTLSIHDAQGRMQSQKFNFPKAHSGIKSLAFDNLAQGRAIMTLETENRKVTKILSIQNNQELLVSLPFGTASLQYRCPDEWQNVSLSINGPVFLSQAINAGQEIIISEIPYGQYQIQMQVGQKIWNQEIDCSPYQRNDLCQILSLDNLATVKGQLSINDSWKTQEILLVPQSDAPTGQFVRATLQEESFIIAAVSPGNYSFMLRQSKDNLKRLVILPIVLKPGLQQVDLATMFSSSSSQFLLPCVPNGLVLIRKNNPEQAPASLDRSFLRQQPNFSWIPLSEGEIWLSNCPDGQYSFHLYQKQEDDWQYQSSVFLNAESSFLNAESSTYRVEWR
ncbi:MAG: sphingomyelin phosphodiesterase [Candidatus Brocadiae bacterium]|nr:sphingomyelin phosphodiesterase [Candidatus Brocadiia bacterium]